MPGRFQYSIDQVVNKQMGKVALGLALLSLATTGYYSGQGDTLANRKGSAAEKVNETSFSASSVGCNTAAEEALIEQIRAYRSARGLPEIPVSRALTKVADLHTADLNRTAYHRANQECNLHSWSGSGPAQQCCYTADHQNKECMQQKPAELTDYAHNGYEVAYWNSRGAGPESSLSWWKTSPPHNQVILNKGQWERVTWKALGVSVQGNYAVVWFGRAEDPRGTPPDCE